MDQKSKVFHSCFTKNRDGANCLIGCGEKCLTPTDQPFWKFPEDVSSNVRTRSQEKEQKKVTKRQFEKYFRYTLHHSLLISPTTTDDHNLIISEILHHLSNIKTAFILQNTKL